MLGVWGTLGIFYIGLCVALIPFSKSLSSQKKMKRANTYILLVFLVFW